MGGGRVGPGGGMPPHSGNSMMGMGQGQPGPPQMGGMPGQQVSMGPGPNMMNQQMMNQQQMHPGMAPGQGMHTSQMAMMRMRMQHQQGMMRMGPGEPGMPGMMPNGAGMEMMQPNGMMMRPGMGSMGGPGRGGMGPGPGMMQGQPGGPPQPGMMGGPMGGMQGPGPGMMGPGHPAMQHSMNSRPPPPEYGMAPQVHPKVQQMPYMMSQMNMGPGGSMRMPGAMGGPGGPVPKQGQGPQVPGVRNQGMQQIPPSGPMMRLQNPLGDRMKMSGQIPPNMMMMGGMGGPGMKQGPGMMGPGGPVMGPRGPMVPQGMQGASGGPANSP